MTGNRSDQDAPGGYVVQVKLGEAAIAAIRDFASSRVPSIDELLTSTFKHVRDRELRRSLAETLYGARWLYHLGLVTLATDVQRAAHVRAQLIDYAAICEAVLLDAVTHGVFAHHLVGTKWQSTFTDGTWKSAKPWKSNRKDINAVIRKNRKFFWMIEVAADEKMIKPALKSELHELRDRRNGVHIAELAAVGAATGLETSKKAYSVMHRCVAGVGDWMALHP